MELTKEDFFKIYFPPFDSPYDSIKYDFINKRLPRKYDNALLRQSCRFPPKAYNSFKDQYEIEIAKSPSNFKSKISARELDKLKINNLINNSHPNELDSFEIYLFNINNPDLLSKDEKVNFLDKDGNPVKVFYNNLVKLLCIYKQFFRNKYKSSYSLEEEEEYNNTIRKIYGLDEKSPSIKFSPKNTTSPILSTQRDNSPKLTKQDIKEIEDILKKFCKNRTPHVGGKRQKFLKTKKNMKEKKFNRKKKFIKTNKRRMRRLLEYKY